MNELKSFIPHEPDGLTPGKFIAVTSFEDGNVVRKIDFVEEGKEPIKLYAGVTYHIWHDDYFVLSGFRGEQAFMSALQVCHRETLVKLQTFIKMRS